MVFRERERVVCLNLFSVNTLGDIIFFIFYKFYLLPIVWFDHGVVSWLIV